MDTKVDNCFSDSGGCGVGLRPGSWHILVQIIWHRRSFLAVLADPGKRLKLHIASEYGFPKSFHTRFATGAPNNKLRSVPNNARSNTPAPAGPQVGAP
jgi:hypothetical protein